MIELKVLGKAENRLDN